MQDTTIDCINPNANVDNEKCPCHRHNKADIIETLLELETSVLMDCRRDDSEHVHIWKQIQDKPENVYWCACGASRDSDGGVIEY